jgi:hypothetical protein
MKREMYDNVQSIKREADKEIKLKFFVNFDNFFTLLHGAEISVSNKNLCLCSS